MRARISIQSNSTPFNFCNFSSADVICFILVFHLLSDDEYATISFDASILPVVALGVRPPTAKALPILTFPFAILNSVPLYVKFDSAFALFVLPSDVKTPVLIGVAIVLKPVPEVPLVPDVPLLPVAPTAPSNPFSPLYLKFHLHQMYLKNQMCLKNQICLKNQMYLKNQKFHYYR